MKTFKFLFIIGLFPTYLFGQNFHTFKVQGDEINGLKPDREQTMKLAMSIFEKVMNDKDFQNELSTFSYQYDVDSDPNRTLTPRQVATKLMNGQEFYKKDNDYTANLHWFIKKKNRPLFSRYPAIGYGNEGGISIYTYTWFFDNSNSDISAIVGHIAHEWSHKVGFEHQFNPHPKRNSTVPYAFGNLVTKYAKKYETQ